MKPEFMEIFWNIKPNKAKALMIAKRQLPEFVYDAVQLEGINFSFPEIQTLLEGITIGGHKISDQQIAINQGNTWKKIFELILENKFSISLDAVCELHRIAAKEEALIWSQFRNGQVYISGTQYTPPHHIELVSIFHRMIDNLNEIEDVYDKAIHLFLIMARTQFFFDVNKRMGRLVMNGFLLNEGFPAINRNRLTNPTLPIL